MRQNGVSLQKQHKQVWNGYLDISKRTWTFQASTGMVYEEVFGVEERGDNRRILSNLAMENNDMSVAGSTSLTGYRWPGLLFWQAPQKYGSAYGI